MRRNRQTAADPNNAEWATVTARSSAAAFTGVSIDDPADRPSLLAMVTPRRLLFGAALASCNVSM